MFLKMKDGWLTIIQFAHVANYKIAVARSSKSTTFNKRALHFYRYSDGFPCLFSPKITLDRLGYVVRWLPGLYVSLVFLYLFLETSEVNVRYRSYQSIEDI